MAIGVDVRSAHRRVVVSSQSPAFGGVLTQKPGGREGEYGNAKRPLLGVFPVAHHAEKDGAT